MSKSEYPITARKMGMTDYTRVEFHKRATLKDFPFKKMRPGEELDDKTKNYVCMVGKCSGVIKEKPKKKRDEDAEE